MSTKTIPLAELNLFKRFMGMTFSEHDPEAITALRKANAILKKHSLNWDDVLGRTVTAAQQQNGYAGPVEEETEELPIKEQIQRAFDELRGTIQSESFKHFIESIERQFIASGYLSKNQRKPLFEAVRRLRARRKE